MKLCEILPQNLQPCMHRVRSGDQAGRRFLALPKLTECGEVRFPLVCDFETNHLNLEKSSKGDITLISKS